MSIVTLPEAIDLMVKDVAWADALRAAEICDGIRERFHGSPKITSGLCYLAGVVEGKRIERAKKARQAARSQDSVLSFSLTDANEKAISEIFTRLITAGLDAVSATNGGGAE